MNVKTFFFFLNGRSKDFANDFLGRTKCTLLTLNCLAGFNPGKIKDCPGSQLSRDRGMNKKKSTRTPRMFK